MKTTHTLFVFTVAALMLLTACGGATPPEPAPVEQPPAVQPAAPATQPPAPAPTEPPAPAPAEPSAPQYAPFCQAAPAGTCEAPTVEMIDNKFCIEKVPYAIMAVPAGTTYTSQNADMQCVDEMVGDSMRITCHSASSKELWSYDLQVCNSACATAPNLQMGTGQCPEGYGFDAASQCCAAPSPASSAGCITYKVDIGACPEPK